MTNAVIAATGLFTPDQSVSNAELVDSFNRYVALHNAEHADAIAAGDVAAIDDQYLFHKLCPRGSIARLHASRARAICFAMPAA